MQQGLFFVGAGLPLAIYLLVLATINRSSRAVMIPGTWDFAGVLLGAFGFLAFGGPAILGAINRRAHQLLIAGGDAPNIAGDGHRLWITIYAAYYLVLVVGAIWLVRRQRNATSVYNVDPDVFGSLLGDVLNQKQINYVQHGNVLYLRAYRSNPVVEEGMPQVEQTTLEVDPSLKFHHVTLRWHPANGALREDVENAMSQELNQVAPPTNPVGDWLLIISGFLFLALLLGVATVILLQHGVI